MAAILVRVSALEAGTWVGFEALNQRFQSLAVQDIK